MLAGKSNLAELSTAVTGLNPDSNGIRCPLNAYDQTRVVGGVSTVAVMTCLAQQQTCRFLHMRRQLKISAAAHAAPFASNSGGRRSHTMLEGLCVTQSPLVCRLQRWVRGLCRGTYRTVGPLRGHWWQLQSSRHCER